MRKMIRVSTVPISLNILLKGQLRFLNKYFEVICVSSPGEDLAIVEQREGIRVISTEMQRNISILRDLKSLIRLYRIFKTEKPDIVHSITPKAGLLSMIAAKFAGIPIRMHTFTGLIFPSKRGLLQKVLILMDSVLCMCATNIYPEGKGVKNDLIKYKITKKKLEVLANGNVNGINMNYFNPFLFSEYDKKSLKKELNIPENDFIFIFIGRLVKDKGVNELVSAFNNLNRTHCSLLLVGPFEPNLDPLDTLTLNSINENSKIISVGFQNDVRPYFAISDVLVFPSHREGFPNVVLQAGAMELPSIVTDINGSNEIITNGKNGLVIPVRDTIALKEAMGEIAENNNLRLQLKVNTRKEILQKYEQTIVWKALLKEYQGLVMR